MAELNGYKLRLVSLHLDAHQSFVTMDTNMHQVLLLLVAAAIYVFSM